MSYQQFLNQGKTLICSRMVFIIVSVLLCAAHIDSQARPFRGSIQMSVILCKSSDAGTPNHDVTYYRDLVINTGTGGLADYWRDLSYQNVNLTGSVVKGWYTVPKTTDQWRQLNDRWKFVEACEKAAKNDPNQPYTIPTGHIKIFVTFPGIDFFGWNGGAFVDSNVDVGGLAHEGGHGLGLNHSFSNNFESLNGWWAQIAEYDDPWDAMSWGNAWRVPTRFGDGPPWMIGYNLDRMGWFPRSRILTIGANGGKHATVTLAALSHPEAPGALFVRVPFDVDDPMHYYTLEFRRKDRWDAGIPTDTLLIHEVRKAWSPHGDYQGHLAFLLRGLSHPQLAPIQQFEANGVSIRIQSMNLAANTVTVNIVTSFPERCMLGFVWREARSYDKVCVSAGDRAAVRDEDNHAAERKNPMGGPFGPDTCNQGFVWREAIVPNPSLGDPPDHVCVPPAARDRERLNNQQAGGRNNPARITYGPNTCKPGFVWREADDWDWVCVTPAVRQQARDDNAQAAARRNPGGGPFGPDTCRQGFVWREAYPGDHVCVLPATRSQAHDDNQHAQERLLEI
jgi:hypothetical protein